LPGGAAFAPGAAAAGRMAAAKRTARGTIAVRDSLMHITILSLVQVDG
jgi:hypothetical protein